MTVVASSDSLEAIARLLTRPPWHAKAACAGSPSGLWFAEKAGPSTLAEQAKQICADCPVRADCLEHALVNGERDGIWGGTDYTERKRMDGWNRRTRATQARRTG